MKLKIISPLDIKRAKTYFVASTLQHSENRLNSDQLVILNIGHLKSLLNTAAFLMKVTRKERNIVSEYDQKIPQSQTADNPVAPRGRAA